MKNDSNKTIPAMKPEYSSHLTEHEYDVIVNKATDRPGSGGYTDFFNEGVYHCRACGAALYKSDAKFRSGCGWPSFDSEIPGSVTKHVDKAFGMVRTEIVCANCEGHLGHVFEGEGYTPANTRHCVNTSSILFHPKNTKTAYLGLGQFHEAQSILQKVNGVLYTETGYANANGAEPRFDAVEKGEVQAIEVVRVDYDPERLSFEQLLSVVVNNKKHSMTNAPQHSVCILTVDESQSAQAIKVIENASGIAVTTLTNYTKAESIQQNVVLRQNSTKR